MTTRLEVVCGIYEVYGDRGLIMIMIMSICIRIFQFHKTIDIRVVIIRNIITNPSFVGCGCDKIDIQYRQRGRPIINDDDGTNDDS